jgi:hypothetical protein
MMNNRENLIWFTTVAILNPYYEANEAPTSTPATLCLTSRNKCRISINTCFKPQPSSASFIRVTADMTVCESSIAQPSLMKVEVLNNDGRNVSSVDVSLSAAEEWSVLACPHSSLYRVSRDLIIRVSLYGTSSDKRLVDGAPLIRPRKHALKQGDFIFVKCSENAENVTVVRKDVLMNNFAYFERMLSGEYEETRGLPFVELKACPSQEAFELFYDFLMGEPLNDLDVDLLMEVFEFCRVIVYPELQMALVEYLLKDVSCGGGKSANSTSDIFTFIQGLGDVATVPDNEKHLWTSVYSEMVKRISVS